MTGEHSYKNEFSLFKYANKVKVIENCYFNAVWESPMGILMNFLTSWQTKSITIEKQIGRVF